MADEKPKDDPSYKCAEYEKTAPLRQIIHDVVCGETALKAGPYLPKFPIEDKDSFSTRLAEATTFPALSKTIGGMVGLVFRKDPALGTDSDAIKKDWENIDLAGTHGDIFIRDVFEDYIADAYSFIVVDFPAEDTNVRSQSDEAASGRRPYWVHYEANQALNWRFTTINGQRKLEQITFREVTCEPAGQFIDQEVVRYRVWTLRELIGEASVSHRAHWAVWEEQKNEKQETEVVLVRSGSTNLKELPVVIIGEIGDEPPLLDLARLNIRYRQQDSNYQKGLAYAGLVIPWARNLDDSSKTKPIGWDILMLVKGDSGEFGLAETTGQALDAHVTALENLKIDMAAIGLSFLVDRVPSEKTATASVIDESQETSQLGSWARRLSDGVERAFQLHGMYLGEEKSGSIDLGSSMRLFTLTSEDGKFYLDCLDKGTLSLESFWQLLQRADKLPVDFDGAKELERIRRQNIIPDTEQ